VRVLLAVCCGVFGAALSWALVGAVAALIFSSGAYGARDPLGAKIGFVFVGGLGALAGFVAGVFLAWTFTSNPATASANAGKMWVGMLGLVITTMIAYGVYNSVEIAKAQNEPPPLSQLYFELELSQAVMTKEYGVREQLTISLANIPARWEEEDVVQADGKVVVPGAVTLLPARSNQPRSFLVFGPNSESWKFQTPIAPEREKAMTWSEWQSPHERSEPALPHSARLRYRVEFGPEVR
jgi:hypothetical protein